MRAMPIQVFTGTKGAKEMKSAFRKNKKHYLQEGLGLALFMFSACFFSAMIFSANGSWNHAIPSVLIKNVAMGLIMGLTALFIFYSPWTAPGGSHINPAVTLTFLRLDKMCRYDAMFYVIFQLIGGTIAVYIMQAIMGAVLTDPPVSSVVTIPGRAGQWWALITEFAISFFTMTMVLFTSHHKWMKQYTRIFSAILVCCWVIVASPVSGFGMNPARSFASALASGIWQSFWIYLFIPLAGMLSAAEFFLSIQSRRCGLKNKTANDSQRTNDKPSIATTT